MITHGVIELIILLGIIFFIGIHIFRFRYKDKMEFLQSKIDLNYSKFELETLKTKFLEKLVVQERSKRIEKYEKNGLILYRLIDTTKLC